MGTQCQSYLLNDLCRLHFPHSLVWLIPSPDLPPPTSTRPELTGTIPTELGLLDAAEQFLIRQNALTGTIPSQLGNLDGEHARLI